MADFNRDIPADQLMRAVKDKLQLLAELGHGTEILTQFAFDPEPVMAWFSQIASPLTNSPGIITPGLIPR